MKNFELIESNPAVLDGQPCVRGTRLTVRRVLSLVGQYPDRAALFSEYPQLNDAAIEQSLQYAAAMLEDRNVSLRPAS